MIAERNIRCKLMPDNIISDEYKKNVLVFVEEDKNRNFEIGNGECGKESITTLNCKLQPYAFKDLKHSKKWKLLQICGKVAMNHLCILLSFRA